MNNYNWLFDLGEMGRVSGDPQQDFNYASNMMIMGQEPIRPTPYHHIEVSNDYSYIADNTVPNPQETTSTFNSQTEQNRTEQVNSFLPTTSQLDRPSNASVQQNFPISPSSLASGSIQSASRDESQPSSTPEASDDRHLNQFSVTPRPAPTMITLLEESSHLPPSPQSRMPKMDQVSRNEILKLLASARPRTPEGSEIGPDHPDLTLSAMQNYLDLFFSRFNVAYPILHQPTFDPSETQTLLLLAVLLLGATYSKKAVHRLAVCIHDVLRGQIFQHPSFSAVPELWMLQTILLVECFGKSRAGQKQHDMAHLFHGLLIKLVFQSPPLPSMITNFVRVLFGEATVKPSGL